MKNDGKYFEKKTHKLVQRLNPNKNVLKDVRIKGKLSESSRQLDVVLKEPEEYDFIAFECKDEKASIGTPTVEAYFTKLLDVGAKHGAIVSNSPYSRGARRMAAKLKIDLLHLVDTSDEKINTKLLMTSVVVHERVRQWNVAFNGMLPKQFPNQSRDWSEVSVKFTDAAPLKIKDLANSIWSNIAEERRPGSYVRDINGLNLFILGSETPLPTMRISMDVEYEYRLGSMDITQSEGIYNVKDGSYQTSSMAVGEFGDEIFRSWTEISKEQVEQIGPSVILTTRSDLTQGHPLDKS